jgi:tripeptide aminopeptidase
MESATLQCSSIPLLQQTTPLTKARLTVKKRRGRKTAGSARPSGRDPQKILLDLLAIPGKSGEEAAVADYIIRQLQRAGVPGEAIQTDEAHRRTPHNGQVGNLVCKLPGSQRAPRRLLMAHMDTVPLCVGAVPQLRGNEIRPADKKTALGADNRAGCAVVLATALEILRGRLPHPPLTFLWTVQEEVGLYGARHARLAALGRPRLAFNFDGGSADKVTVGATGGYRMEIHVHGLASHAGTAPEEGVSAIAIASMAIARLHRGGWHGRVQKAGRTGTSNVGVIRGGQATNVVTPYVRVHAEARSHDPAFRLDIVHTIEQAFREAASSVRSASGKCGKARIEGRLDYEAFKLPDDDPSVLAAEAAIRAAGRQPVRAMANGGLDANWLTARGIPTVSLGCGQLNPHTTDERLDLKQFRSACNVALRLASGNGT